MSKAILNQHIFRLNVDKRTENYNQKWFDETVVPTFNADKNGGFLPTVHVGHNDGVSEKPRVAFMDNLRRVGNDVFCDMTEIPDVLAPELQANLWPNRSVEIRADGKGFASTALLGGTEPHFKLAQSNQLVENHFKALPTQDGTPTIIKFEATEMTLSDAIDVQDKNDDAWKVDSALWSKLWDIKNSETMTPEEKKAEIDKALSEYVGMQATIQKEIIDITDGGDGSAAASAADTTQAAQFKAIAGERAKMEQQFAAREAALQERENEHLEKELTGLGLAGPVVKNFLALGKHVPNVTKSIQFKAGDKTEEVTPCGLRALRPRSRLPRQERHPLRRNRTRQSRKPR